MPSLRTAIATLLLASTPLAALPISASAQTCTCGAAYAVRSEDPPPPLPEYEQPPLPEPGYIWTPGYWYWNNVDYYWVPGTWVEPPRRGLLWTPGYWGYSDGIYVYNRGYWGPHVGFYGGVDYGFGYDGSGYRGGRWEDGEFTYNRTVNNFGSTHITNVYNEKVVIENASPNRASFNGGAGGIAVKPTAEQEAVAKEPHEKPTNLQLTHTREASVNPDSFESKNHGKPPVAATVLPGKLTGPGVVKAKAAGASTTDTPTPSPSPSQTPKVDSTPAKEPLKTPDKGDPNKPVKTPDEKPTKTLDEKPGKALDEKPPKTLDEKPTKALDEKPVKGTDEKPAKTMDEKPVKRMDEKPAKTLDEKPTKALDEKPVKRMDEKPAKTLEERPSKGGDEKPPRAMDEKSKSMEMKPPAPKPSVERTPELRQREENSQPRVREEKKPDFAPNEGKSQAPRPGPQRSEPERRDCGHPGQPACH